MLGLIWSCCRRRVLRSESWDAWRKHLPFSGERMDKGPNETLAAFKHRTKGRWGLLEWVVDTCDRFKVNLLLVEAAGPGISAAQDLQNRFGAKPGASTGATGEIMRLN
jgi:hypothetical protein